MNNSLNGCSFEQEGTDFYITGADSVRKKLGRSKLTIPSLSARNADGRISTFVLSGLSVDTTNYTKLYVEKMHADTISYGCNWSISVREKGGITVTLLSSSSPQYDLKYDISIYDTVIFTISGYSKYSTIMMDNIQFE